MGSIDRQDSTPLLLNRLRMRQVALLLAIEERGTLRGAAAQLGLSQPAATKMLHELESALDLRLFERVGRGLQLNASGERVTRYFRHIRGSVESLNRELGDLRQGSAGRIAVGSIMAASPGRLTHSLLALKRRFPLLSIEVAVDTSDRLLAQLREGVLDVVIGRLADPTGTDYAFRPIADEALSIVAGCDHPLAARTRLRFEELLAHPWVLQPTGSPMRELIEREFQAHHQALPRGLVETGSILTTVNLVRSSDLVAVIPEAVARQHAQHGLIAILPYRLQHTLEAYGSMVRLDRPLSSATQQFLALLHAEVSEMVDGPDVPDGPGAA